MSLEPQRDAPETATVPGGAEDGRTMVLMRQADEDGEGFSKRVAHARAAGAERLKAQADKRHVVNWRSHMTACFDVPLAAGSPNGEAQRRVCPDGGTCHHGCGMNGGCWRVFNASPLSGWGDRWPPHVVGRETALAKQNGTGTL